MERIKNHDTKDIPTYVAKIWDFYHSFQYVSPNTPKGAVGSFEKMLDYKAEIGVASIPVWRVSLEAPNYPKEAFPDGIPVYFHFDGYSGDVEMPGIFGSREVLAIHQEQGCGSYQSDDGWAKTDEDALDGCGVHILVQHLADKNHQNQGWENQRKGRHGTSEYSHHATHAGIMDSCIATIGSGVDTDRSRCHLRDGNHIGKLLHRHPMILRNNLSLDEG
jgi:hypothetical protein